MVSQWMLTPNCWICQQRMACDDLRSCKSAIRSSEDRYVQVDRSPQHLLPNRFSGRKTHTFRLIPLFFSFPYSHFSQSCLLFITSSCSLSVSSKNKFSSDLDVLEARSSLDSYTGDFWHWKPYMQKDFNVKRHKNKGREKEQGINGVITAWWGQKAQKGFRSEAVFIRAEEVCSLKSLYFTLILRGRSEFYKQNGKSFHSVKSKFWLAYPLVFLLYFSRSNVKTWKPQGMWFCSKN